MADLNLDLDYFGHPKTRRLVGLLGRGSDVLPIRLWCYCGKYHAESGRLTGHAAQEIEAVIDWWGKSGECVKALVQVGFLDREEDGTYIVHDWMERSGHIAAIRERNRSAALIRWEKYRSECNAAGNASALHAQSPILPSSLPPSQREKKKSVKERLSGDL